jgi:hypothetical protein
VLSVRDVQQSADATNELHLAAGPIGDAGEALYGEEGIEGTLASCSALKQLPVY